ncbi:hypothetical protein Hanom_Chr13g01235521 [Helianthus anomalus]
MKIYCFSCKLKHNFDILTSSDKSGLTVCETFPKKIHLFQKVYNLLLFWPPPPANLKLTTHCKNNLIRSLCCKIRPLIEHQKLGVCNNRTVDRNRTETEPKTDKTKPKLTETELTESRLTDIFFTIG